MNNKKRFVCIASSVFLLAVFLLVARHNNLIGHRTFPWYLAEKWYCEEIDMTLAYTMHEDGYLIDSPNSMLTVGGKQYDVFAGFYGTNLVSFRISEDGNNIKESGLRGVWHYRFGKLVIRILEESIFDGQYTELVFVPCDD